MTDTLKFLRWMILKLFLVLILGLVFSALSSTAQAATISQQPLKIIIPSAEINLPIETAQIAYNTWEVSNNAASFGQGTTLPGNLGNTVIFAHARDGLFGSLPLAKTGDMIYIFTAHSWYAYQITDILIVSPTDIGVIKQSEGAELTLFTCTGPQDSHRLVIKATLAS